MKEWLENLRHVIAQTRQNIVSLRATGNESLVDIANELERETNALEEHFANER